MKKYKDIESYIKSFPPKTQAILRKMRSTVKKAAPKMPERISYGMPSIQLKGDGVYYGAFKDHVSLFPGSGSLRSVFKELKKYEGGKGTIKFPLDKPLPVGLIAK